MKRILAIETSCDESAVAVVSGNGTDLALAESNAIASQIALHAQFGGVFPDLAAREHVKKIIPTISLGLHKAGLIGSLEPSKVELEQALAKIDAIAITVGPGLIGSLLVGVNAASQLAYLANKPIIPTNHWEGHLYSVFLKSQNQTKAPDFPILTLTVSGGHTSLILIKGHFEYEILGNTVDDAAGEAFDKTARLLELGYPGGPALSKEAAIARENNLQSAFKLPRPMLDSADLNFSFSGLKTAVRYAIDRGDIDLFNKQIAAREIEDAIIDVLIGKLKKASQQIEASSIAIVGGVSANRQLRLRAQQEFGSKLYIPDFEFTTDNAAMIGAAAIFRLAQNRGVVKNPLTIEANASLRL